MTIISNFFYKLFNKEARDTQSRTLFKTFEPKNLFSTTGIFNLENIKYPKLEEFYQKQASFIWFPREISLTDDKNEFESLNQTEKKAFERIISFLAFLDSIQSQNLADLYIVSNSYELKRALAIHNFIEGGIHTEAYQWILKSIFGDDSQKINKIYYEFKNYAPLRERNELIANTYQKLFDIIQLGIVNVSNEKYLTALFENLIQDYFLESVIFYMGFNFFHILAIRYGKLQGVNKEITLIRRDEQLHVWIFKEIIQEFMNEMKALHPQYAEEIVYEIAKKSALADIKFYIDAIGDNMYGITADSIETYIKHLTDRRLVYLGFKPIFGKLDDNPFKDIEMNIGYNVDSNDSITGKKESFFETGSTEYKHITKPANFDSIKLDV